MAVPARYPMHAPRPEEEQRILLYDVPWATYVMLRDSLDHRNLRMTYLEGRLEIMSPSREHELDKKQIARFLELFCLERDIPLYAYGSTTFRKEDRARGLEPDECYSRGEDKLIPDIALEVVKTHGTLDKLAVYQGLGVREVWIFEASVFSVLALRGDHYETIARSEVLPEIDPPRLATFVQRPDQHEALKAYRDELRAPR